MKALLRKSDTPKDFALGEVLEPVTPPGMVKIKVAYSGICGSDLHIYLGQEAGLPQGIHGHEFSGWIAGLGEGVENLNVGQRVTAEHTASTCGVCQYCKTGRYQLCQNRHSIGFDTPGSFTEYVLVDPQYVHPLPDNVSLKQGALTEPLACIIHAIELVDVKPGLPVLVVGPGPMGLLAGLALKAYGCQVDILGTEADRERLERAAAAGLHVVSEAKPGAYPLAAECSGAGGGIRAGLTALEKGGTLLQVGIATRPVELPYDQMVYRELKIQGTFCHTWKDWRQALRLEETGLLDLSPVITGVVKLDDWKEAFEDLLDKKGMKTLFVLNEEAES
ncbi:hypothetical protein D1159_14870 [Pseudoflavonifractor sp. 524-17]|uniref:zinc-dependent alcohol dehydrogenase n=1 Tax=Pseudoflavonifractor sp. 524-17 TaxID=2304577 RepID=UPI00137B39AE|nr:alcohol dehydrogenase catalytic domain-containing protein [Pseudoflavonifractor sp. 524-17]NCE65823.1 hypothetical protein [Pseudoflavonifractor sp. 524-17]